MQTVARNVLIRSLFGGDAALAYVAKKCLQLERRYRALREIPEDSPADVAEKLERCWAIAGEFPIDRAWVWTEIARLERLRGNELLAAVYELRTMRALGEDRFGQLPATAASLRRGGFPREAEAAEAMFGAVPNREDACRSLLEEAYDAHQTNPPRAFEKIDDRRTSSSCRVSVIVSLYKAAAKLPTFFQSLQKQTLLSSGAMEIVLVDSGSPNREYEVFQRFAESSRLPMIYARSSSRETIQAAWNRGISLARAPFLAFLGVDETVTPDAFEVLAAELDRDPDLDWVIGSSQVTAVDERGDWKEDVFLYDRAGYHPTLPYLETCYLSWVGALYRRSIHDRFGYYDATFGAAGDTEFKNRVLPHLKTKAIPCTLGIFWNYPEARTTESPRAEIEDLRAWYLHRTAAGVEYALRQRDPREALELFHRCLRYRKSFLKHDSTDLDYACQVADYVERSSPGLLPASQAASVRELLAVYRQLDWLSRTSRWSPIRQLFRVRRATARARAGLRRLSGNAVDPACRIFNDNRYEQHRHVWRSPIGS